MNFTASLANFGALETIALEHGGENRTVTLANREEFVHQLFNWHLTGQFDVHTSNTCKHVVSFPAFCTQALFHPMYLLQAIKQDKAMG